MCLLRHGGGRMRLVCRKCGLECDATTFEEVEQYQRMTCGAGGTHRLVGRL